MNAQNSTDNIYIRVRAVTSAKKESVTEHKGVYTITVKEKAERGAANIRIKTLLADTLAQPAPALRLIKGAQTPSKLFQLVGNKKQHEN